SRGDPSNSLAPLTAPPLPKTGIFGGFVVQAPWSKLQPDNNPTVDTTIIETALTAGRAYKNKTPKMSPPGQPQTPGRRRGGRGGAAGATRQSGPGASAAGTRSTSFPTILPRLRVPSGHSGPTPIGRRGRPSSSSSPPSMTIIR